jgi:long-chain-fatty-acid--CoA ligase ACSBG
VILFLALGLIFLRRSGPKAKVATVAPFKNEGDNKKSAYPPAGSRQFWNSDRKVANVTLFAKEGLASEDQCPAQTLGDLFKSAAEAAGNKPALRFEDPCPAFNTDTKVAPPSAPFSEWKTLSYQEYYQECRTTARAFLALGLERFEAVTIYGFNCPQWFMSEMGGIFAGGIAAGIYPSDTEEQVIFKARHSSAAIACCQANKASLFKQAVADGKLPKMRAIVIWGSDEKDSDISCGTQTVKVTTWGKLAQFAEQTSDADLDAAMDSQQPGHAAAYIYTSGTTGTPKAVMITHDNIIFESLAAMSLMPQAYGTTGEERVVSYLPLSHVAGCMVDIVMPVITTARNAGRGHVVVGFARVYDLSKSTIGDRLRCIRPTIFLGVPRVWEKIAAKVQKAGASSKGLQKKIATFCKAKGLEHALNCNMGESGEKPSFYALADKVVFKKVKKLLGLDACKFGFTGAAPITTETLSYFGALGLQINEVYGMSECTGATTWSTDEAHVWGSCGWTMPGTEVKIFIQTGATINDKKEAPLAADIFNATEAEQGEICFRGRHIMAGYMANPDLGEEHVALIQKKNREAIDDEGWLHSGDKGCIGANGMLKITGRYKELIIGSGGENIAPVPIENNVKKLCPAIANIVMIGDKKKYNIALVTLKAKGATGEQPGGDELDAEALGVTSATLVSQAMTDEKYISIINDAIVATNNNGSVCPSNASKIQKFSILPRDFSVETGELTPTLKTIRGNVEKKNADVIRRAYEPGAPNYIPYRA